MDKLLGFDLKAIAERKPPNETEFWHMQNDIHPLEY